MPFHAGVAEFIREALRVGEREAVVALDLLVIHRHEDRHAAPGVEERAQFRDRLRLEDMFDDLYCGLVVGVVFGEEVFAEPLRLFLCSVFAREFLREPAAHVARALLRLDERGVRSEFGGADLRLFEVRDGRGGNDLRVEVGEFFPVERAPGNGVVHPLEFLHVWVAVFARLFEGARRAEFAPRTAGAYVLYPGTKDRTYRYGDEILPGLGAFPLYPRDDNSDDEPIRAFLASVAEYLCDRITRWENYTYQKNLAFAGTREEWGRYQAAIAHRYKYAENVGDMVHNVRDNLSDRENLALIPPEQFLSVAFGGGKKKQGGKYSRDKQVRWIYEHKQFVKSSDQALDCAPEDLLMITAMWYPPFSMMVKRYCGKRARAELEADGKPLPFPARNGMFHVWDVSLYNFDEVAKYLNGH